jgi:hypothetical protein
MNIKPPLQKILHGILHTENGTKKNYERTGNTKPQKKKKTKIQRVILIQLHTIRPSNNKNN